MSESELDDVLGVLAKRWPKLAADAERLNDVFGQALMGYSSTAVRDAINRHDRQSKFGPTVSELVALIPATAKSHATRRSDEPEPTHEMIRRTGNWPAAMSAGEVIVRHHRAVWRRGSRTYERHARDEAGLNVWDRQCISHCARDLLHAIATVRAVADDEIAELDRRCRSIAAAVVCDWRDNATVDQAVFEAERLSSGRAAA